mmetsp:Transcript_72711/g.217073  ORF Transcript_72711/g.217073 Transcript_72711/m.217073 type:complete len:207 (-) Transcript_72711:309-929(-)
MSCRRWRRRLLRRRASALRSRAPRGGRRGALTAHTNQSPPEVLLFGVVVSHPNPALLTIFFPYSSDGCPPRDSVHQLHIVMVLREEEEGASYGPVQERGRHSLPFDATPVQHPTVPLVLCPFAIEHRGVEHKETGFVGQSDVIHEGAPKGRGPASIFAAAGICEGPGALAELGDDPPPVQQGHGPVRAQVVLQLVLQRPGVDLRIA